MNCPLCVRENCEYRIECLIGKCQLPWQRQWPWKIEGVRSYKLLTGSNAHKALNMLSMSSCWGCEIRYGIQSFYLLQLLVLGLVKRVDRFFTITKLGMIALRRLDYTYLRSDRFMQNRVEVDVEISTEWLEHAKLHYW